MDAVIMIVGAFVIIFASVGYARDAERERWCRHLYKTVVEVEACQERPDWGKDEP